MSLLLLLKPAPLVFTDTLDLSGSGSLTASGVATATGSLTLSGSGTLTTRGVIPYVLTNRCDGANATTVTTSNTSGPDQFSTIAVAGAGLVKFDTSIKHSGSSSIQITAGATSSNEALRWTNAAFGGADQNFVSMRGYYYLTAYPAVAATAYLMQQQMPNTGTRCKVVVGTDGKLGLGDQTSSITYSTTVLPLNQWFRIEMDCDSRGNSSSHVESTGAIVSRLYTNLSSTTPTETITISSPSLGSYCTAVNFGPHVAGTQDWVFNLDDVGFNNYASIGPYTPAETGTLGLSGSGTLARTGVPSFTGSCSLSGTGALDVGSSAKSGSLALSGSGTLTATGTSAQFSATPGLARPGLLVPGYGSTVVSSNYTGNLSLSGSGAQTSSATITASSATTVVTNLITNPSFETSTSGWTAFTGTNTRITSGGFSGSSFTRMTNTAGGASAIIVTSSFIPVVSVGTYTLSYYIKATTPIATDTLQGFINEYDAGGNSVGQTATGGYVFPALTTSWNQVKYTGTLTPGTTQVKIEFDRVFGTASTTVDLDAIMLTTTTDEYFDGSTTDTTDYRYDWTGTTNLSTSTSTALSQRLTGTGTLTGTGVASFSGTVALSGSGTVTGAQIVTGSVNLASEGTLTLSGTVVTAATYRGAMTSNRTGTTSTGNSTITLTFPAGTVAGDAAIIAGSFNSSAETATAAAGVGNTWTITDGPNNQANVLDNYMWARLLTSTDIAQGSVTITWGSGGRVAGMGIVFSNVDQVTPFGTDAYASVSSSTLTMPSVTTTVALSGVASIVLTRNTSTTAGSVVTFPTGCTTAANSATAIPTSPNFSAAVGYRTTPGAAGSYGGGSITTGATATHMAGYTIAIRPGTSTGQDFTGTADLTGSGTLTASGTPGSVGTLTLSSSGTLTATGVATLNPWLNRVTIAAPRNATTSHTVDPSSGTVIDGVSFTPTADRVLLCLMSGAVTSTTPTGWTLPTNGSSIGSTGLYAWYRTAAGGDTVTTTHNGSNYAVAVEFFEFEAGSSFSGAATAAGVSRAGGAGPVLSGLVGPNFILFAGSQNNTQAVDFSNTTSWSTGVETTDTSTTKVVTDAYTFSTAYLDKSFLTSASSAATYTNTVNTVERLTLAVKVAVPAALSGSGDLTGSGVPGATSTISYWGIQI